MTIVFFALKILGLILVCGLLLTLLLLCIFLFVPFCYEGSLCVADPLGSEEFDFSSLKEKTSACFHVTFLFRALRASFTFPASVHFCIRILCFSFDGQKLLNRFLSDEKEEPKGKKSEKEKSGESLLIFLKKKRAALREVQEEAKEVMGDRDSILSGLREVLRPLLPKKWSLTGTVGFTDPSVTGLMMELEGMLIPFTGSHLFVLPDFNVCRLDLKGDVRGKVRMASILKAILSMTDLTGLMRLLRGGKEDEKSRGETFKERAEEGPGSSGLKR